MVCVCHSTGTDGPEATQNVTLCLAQSQGSFTQLLMDISELKMELWAGSTVQIFSRH